MKVHIVYPPEGEAERVLQEKLDKGIEITTGQDLPNPNPTQVLVAGRPEAEMIEQSPRLESLIIPWAGVPTGTRLLMEKHPEIKVHNLHHNAVPTAELTIGLLLAVAKQILIYDQKLRSHNWEMRYQPDQTILLQGKRALVVGYGEIGSHAGRALQALGVEVHGIRRSPTPRKVDQTEIHRPDEMMDLLPGMDFLILTLPLTDETRGLIGQAELSALPSRAIVVNVSRGPIIDQEALYRALKEKTIYGAGLDVWYQYPRETGDRQHTPPADFPFHELENVVMSPHRAGKSSAIENMRMSALARSLNAAYRGEPLPNPVNIQLGY